LRYLEPSKAVIIGASTGGPSHIRKILLGLGKGFTPAVIIAQHMGSEYLQSFAQGLALECGIETEVVCDGLPCRQKSIYICDKKTRVIRSDQGLIFRVEPREKHGYNPDIDHLFLSLKELSSRLELLALLLTGIGEDGVRGIGELSKLGVRCIAESSESAVVYGMPMRAKEIGINEIKNLEEIVHIVSEFGRGA